MINSSTPNEKKQILSIGSTYRGIPVHCHGGQDTIYSTDGRTAYVFDTYEEACGFIDIWMAGVIASEEMPYTR